MATKKATDTTTEKKTTRKTATSTETTKAAAAPKKAAAAAPKKAAATPKKSASSTSITKPSPAERNHMIEVAAYYIAEKNNFQGCTASYWTQAEAQISAQLGE